MTPQCLLLVLSVLLWADSASSLTVQVAEVSNYTKLRSWKESSLYRVEVEEGLYEVNPLLLHLVGSRYGESNTAICTW